MNLLALDASTSLCSVALVRDGIYSVREADAGQQHSALLIGMIDELLRKDESALADLQGIAFGAGPGSFTGLRIACGIVQGLAAAADLPVLGVDTLQAMAQQLDADEVICCIDARMSEVYCAAYRRRGALWETVLPPGVYPPAAVPLPPAGRWTACGNGFGVYGEALMGRYADRLAAVRADVLPHAREIAVLAVPGFRQGLGQAAEFAIPAYIRDKVALRSDERPR